MCGTAAPATGGRHGPGPEGKGRKVRIRWGERARGERQQARHAAGGWRAACRPLRRVLFGDYVRASS